MRGIVWASAQAAATSFEALAGCILVATSAGGCAGVRGADSGTEINSKRFSANNYGFLNSESSKFEIIRKLFPYKRARFPSTFAGGFAGEAWGW